MSIWGEMPLLRPSKLAHARAKNLSRQPMSTLSVCASRIHVRTLRVQILGVLAWGCLEKPLTLTQQHTPHLMTPTNPSSLNRRLLPSRSNSNASSSQLLKSEQVSWNSKPVKRKKATISRLACRLLSNFGMSAN